MSEEKKKKVYLGAGNKKSETWITAALKEEVLNTAHWETYEGKKFIRVNINMNSTPDKYGKDVSITLNDYKPNATVAQATENQKDDDLPF